MELMVVVVIIGLVTSVIAYNVKGSLDRGRAFKTDEALNKIEDVITVAIPSSQIEKLVKDPSGSLAETGLLKNSKHTVADGWGAQFAFTQESPSSIKVESVTDPTKFRIIELTGAVESGEPSDTTESTKSTGAPSIGKLASATGSRKPIEPVSNREFVGVTGSTKPTEAGDNEELSDTTDSTAVCPLRGTFLEPLMNGGSRPEEH